jgi:hypothetical protein
MALTSERLRTLPKQRRANLQGFREPEILEDLIALEILLRKDLP